MTERKNLHLQFRFIDRAGRAVYEIYDPEDNKRLLRPLGTLILSEGDAADVAPFSSSFALVRWVPKTKPADETTVENPDV